MKPAYEQWLHEQQYAPPTVIAQLNRVRRVEECYGDLDQSYYHDKLSSVISELQYSVADERGHRENPSKIQINGNIRNNLNSYRDAVRRYKRYLDLLPQQQNQEPSDNALDELSNGQKFSFERDMQASLRKEIGQLESGIEIIDEGAERSVDSGFIDITCRDSSGNIVVIELKAGTANQRAIAQILSYMGDISIEEEGKKVRGILVAADFDKKTIAAARMVPDLTLRKYSVRFSFTDVV